MTLVSLLELMDLSHFWGLVASLVVSVKCCYFFLASPGSSWELRNREKRRRRLGGKSLHTILVWPTHSTQKACMP